MSRPTRPRSRDLWIASTRQSHKARRRQIRQQLRAAWPLRAPAVVQEAMARLDRITSRDGLLP